MKRLLYFLTIVFTLFCSHGTVAQTEEWLYLSKSNFVYTISEGNEHIWISDVSGITLVDKQKGTKSYLNKTTTPWIDCAFRRILTTSDGKAWAWPYEDYFYQKDGNEWTRYTTENTPLSMSYNPAAVDDNNVLWMADTLLLSFDGVEWKSHAYPSGVSIFKTNQMVAHKNTLWLLSNIGLLRFEDGKWTQFGFESGAAPDFFVQMKVDTNGVPWLLYQKTLLYLKNGQLSSYHEAPEEVVSGYSSMHVFDKYNIWLGASQVKTTPFGVPVSLAYHFDGGEWTPYGNSMANEHHLPLKLISRIWGAENGEVWFSGEPLAAATHAIVRKMNKQCVPFDHSKATLSNGLISKISPLKEGVVVHCRNGGLSEYEKGNWRMVEPYDEQFMDLCTDAQGTVYSKTERHVRIHKPSGSTVVATYPVELWMHFVDKPTEIQVDGKGNVWIDFVTVGSEFGPLKRNVARYDGSAWISYHRTVDSFPESNFIEMDVDHSGNLWVRNEHGVYKYSGETFQQITTYPAELRLQYTGFEVDVNGNIWLPGPQASLFKFDGTEWQHIENASPIPSDWGVLIDSDQNGTVFLNVGGDQLFQYDGSTWTRFFSESSAIPTTGNIHAMKVDEHGNLWMGLSSGILVYRTGGVTLSDEWVSAVRNKLSLFPNPCTNQVEVQWPDYLETPSVEVFNMQGHSVLSRKYGGSNHIKIEDLNLAPGTYVLQIRTQNGSLYTSRQLVVAGR